MAARKYSDSSTRFTKQNAQLKIRTAPFKSDKVVIAAKSAKIAHLLKEHPHKDISIILKDLHVDQQTFELVVRFSRDLDIILTPQNVVPLSCLAHYLGMTDSHCPNNLLQKAFDYFEFKILPSWDDSLKALKSSENVLQQADRIGLVDALFKSLIKKAIDNPCLVSDSISGLFSDNEGEKENENGYAPSAKRRLFDTNEGRREELTILCIQMYEQLIREMITRLVPSEYILGSICHYARTWVFLSNNREDDANNQREIIEAIGRLLPEETNGLIPCVFLSEMLKYAIILNANENCRKCFEIRIGNQLENATVNDLLIPTQGYAKEVEYDVECVKRIMKIYYRNYKGEDLSGIISVAELMDRFLAEVASDVDLRPKTFLSLAEMSVSASVGTNRNSDGIYRAIDTYLSSHKHLTESEREEVCRALDCYKMSVQAREHAAQNDKLPLRVVVQVLFVGQLHLRDTIVNDIGGNKDEEEKVEMEKMGSKVMELEKECNMMRKEIKKEKASVWREMKRKFGCYNGSMEEKKLPCEEAEGSSKEVKDCSVTTSTFSSFLVLRVFFVLLTGDYKPTFQVSQLLCLKAAAK